MNAPTLPAPLRAAQPFLAALIAAMIVQYLIIPHLGGYASELLVDCGIAVILAVSLTAVNGFTGQFSIGHAGFMAVGGYMAAAIVYYGSFRLFGDFAAHPGWKGQALFAGACLSGGILAAAFGWIVGLPSLRLRGDYLAIVTLGFGEIVRVIIQGTSDQLDASSVQPAINDLSFPALLFHLGSALGFSGQPVYTTPFCVWFAAALTVMLTIRLKYSGYGRALLSIREDDIAAQMIGVNTTRLKVRAFMYSAFFAGIGGALYAMKLGSTINAADFGFQRSFDYVIMVVLGGLGSISGAAIAAIVLTLLPELLRGFDMYRMIIYALLLIVIMIVRPQGLLGQGEIWDRFFHRRKRA
jgi:branched-chain amino acid transport system permease protein